MAATLDGSGLAEPVRAAVDALLRAGAAVGAPQPGKRRPVVALGNQNGGP